MTGGLFEIFDRLGLLAQTPAEALVPGDPDAAEAMAADARTTGERLGDAGATIDALTVVWEGDAATAYRARQRLNADGWRDAAGNLDQARKALLTYADALRDAKKDAVEAVAMFEEGMRLAATQHVERYEAFREAMAETPFPIPAYEAPSRAALDEMPAGRSSRDAAVDLLNAAQESVRTAGDTCAASLDSLSDPMPWSESGLGGLAETPGTEGDPDDRGPHDPLTGPVPLDDASLLNDMFSQGQIGDCWFLAGAGSVANADPDWIRDHIRQNSDGSYTVTLYEDGEPVDVRVEASVIRDGVRGADGLPSWISLYEKAAAQHLGGEYDDVAGGYSSDALEMVTGREVETDNDQSLEDIQRGLDEGRIFAVSTETDGSLNPFDDEVDDDRVVPNHAYMIDEVRRNDDGELEVHVVNPWGPDGGSLDGEHKDGDMWLTEDQLHGSFDDVYSVAGR